MQIKDYVEQTTLTATDNLPLQTATGTTKRTLISTLQSYLGLASGLIMSSAVNTGIKLDKASPDFGYEDLKGHKVSALSGGAAPTREQFKTGVYSQAYNQDDYVDWSFHIEHRDFTGGDKRIHLHLKLAENATYSGANLVVTCVIGHFYHNRTGAPAPITKTFTITAAQINAAQNGTLVVEQLFAQTGGGTGLLDSTNMQIDDDIQVTCTFTTVGTITGGAHGKVGFDHCDIHRKVTGVGTKYYEMATTGSFHGTT